MTAKDENGTLVEIGPLSQDSGTSPDLDFPDGGFRGWMTVLGGFLVLFCTTGMSQSFGVFQDYYTRISLNEESASDISWIGSAQFGLFYCIGLPAGKLFDEGYFNHIMAFGSVLFTFSLFMVSITEPHHYYQVFLSQGLGMGIGTGFMLIPTLSVISHYFRRRRGLAQGIAISGSSLGGVIWPIMLNHLINSSVGFAWAVRAVAFITLVLLFVANLLMKTRLPSRKERVNYVAPSLRSILSDTPYILCIVGGWLVFWGMFFPFFYLQLFAVLHGVSTNLAFYSITILNTASIFGRTIPNFLGDRWGNLNIMLLPTVIAACLITVMLRTPTSGGVIVFAMMYGFFSGAFFSMINPALTSFATSPNEVGIRIGIAAFFFGIALLTGTPIGGALLDPPHYVWSRAVAFNVAVILAGSAILGISRMMLAKRRGSSLV